MRSEGRMINSHEVCAGGLRGIVCVQEIEDKVEIRFQSSLIR